MALALNAAGDSLSRTGNLPTITSWTICGWVRLDGDNNNYSTFWSLGNGAASSYQLGTDSDGTSLIQYNPQSGIATITALSLSVWYWLAFTVAGTGAGQVNVYLNGALVLTTDGSATPTAVTLFVGNNSNSEFLQGTLANVLVYSGVLSLDEQDQQRRQYLPLRHTNLNGWYPFTSSERDYSINGNHLTLAGSLPQTDGPPLPWSLSPPFRKAHRRLFMP